MKLAPYLFILSLLLVSCNYSVYRPLAAPAKLPGISDRFINIGLLPHNREVNVYLPNESLPDSLVLPVRLVEEKSYYNGYTSLINKIKSRAQRQGLDGVIILERELINEVYEGSSSTYQVATGIGFIYKNTLSQVDKFPKRKYLEVMANGSWEQVATSEFSTFGKVIDTEVVADSLLKEIYLNNIARFDFDVLRSVGGKEWYRREGYSQLNGFHESVYSKRIHSSAKSNVFTLEEIRFLCWRKNEIAPALVEHTMNTIQVNEKQKGPTVYQHNFTYDKQSRLSKVEILQNKPKKESPLILVQQFEYDKQNRKIASVWFRVENGKEIPFVRTSFSYYSPEDFLPSLRLAPDIPMRASASKL